MSYCIQQTGRCQRGTSLVELLVGILLSMITVLAAMGAYKALVHTSLSSAAHAKTQDVAAGLSVQLARLVPQAGWGVGAASTPMGAVANTDLVLLAGAAFSAGTLSGAAQPIDATVRSGNALVWDSAFEGTVQCSALVAPSDGGLLLLGPVACTNAAQWAGLAWPAATTLLAADALPGAGFTAQRTECFPYISVEGGASAVQVTFTGTQSAATVFCLTNIPN